MKEDLAAFKDLLKAIGRLLLVIAQNSWSWLKDTVSWIYRLIPELEPQDDPFCPLSPHYLNDEAQEGCKCRACYFLRLRPISTTWDLDEAVEEVKHGEGQTASSTEVQKALEKA